MCFGCIHREFVYLFQVLSMLKWYEMIQTNSRKNHLQVYKNLPYIWMIVCCTTQGSSRNHNALLYMPLWNSLAQGSCQHTHRIRGYWLLPCCECLLKTAVLNVLKYNSYSFSIFCNRCTSSWSGAVWIKFPSPQAAKPTAVSWPEVEARIETRWLLATVWDNNAHSWNK